MFVLNDFDLMFLFSMVHYGLSSHTSCLAIWASNHDTFSSHSLAGARGVDVDERTVTMTHFYSCYRE